MQDSDFIFQLKYSNTLPEVPSGPYFKDIPPIRKLEEYAKYSTSSLERSYVWQPHFGPEAGAKIDLQDQDSVLVNSKEEPDHLDMRYLSASTTGKGHESRNSYFWIRNTVYSGIAMGSDSKSKETSLEKKKSAEENATVKQNMEVDEIARIKKSFHDAASFRESLVGRADEIESVQQILPDDSMWAWQLYMANFDVNPAYLKEVGGGEVNFQKNLLTNIRSSESDPTGANKRELFNLSLVAPKDASLTMESKDDSAPVLDKDSTLYEWVRDFKVQIRTGSTGNYIFAFSDKESVFCPSRAAISLKRIGNDESAFHDAVVKRRKLNKEENRAMKQLEREISC